VGLNSAAGAAVIQAGLKVSVKGNEVHILGGGGQLVMKDGKVYINSGNAEQPSAVWRGRPEGQQTSESDSTVA
jgi:hypothetical protein